MTIEQIAATAANWWAERLTFGPSGLSDSRLSSLGTCFTIGMTAEQAQAQQFRDTLTQRIMAALATRGRVTLSHDYQPSGLLKQVADEAGISTVGFPQKTSMTVTREGITLGQGYAAQPVKIETTGHKWISGSVGGLSVHLQPGRQHAQTFARPGQVDVAPEVASEALAGHGGTARQRQPDDGGLFAVFLDPGPQRPRRP